MSFLLGYFRRDGYKRKDTRSNTHRPEDYNASDDRTQDFRQTQQHEEKISRKGSLVEGDFHCEKNFSTNEATEACDIHPSLNSERGDIPDMFHEHNPLALDQYDSWRDLRERLQAHEKARSTYHVHGAFLNNQKR